MNKLKRELGLLDVFCIATGAMVSSGIFVIPGLAHKLAGPAVIISYFLAGIITMVGMLSLAELSTAMPKAGGDYFFATRSMGPSVGTIAGLLSWFSLSLKSSFALIGMAAFTNIVFPDFDVRIIAFSLCLIFMVLNILGVREASGFQIFLVITLIVLMLIYIGTGFSNLNSNNLLPFAPNGFPAVISTVGFVFVAYGGILHVASMAEEVKDPGRNIPLGMILSVFAVIVFYTLMVFVTSGVLTGSELDNSLTPISDGARAFMGSFGFVLLSIGAMLAFISTANAGMMASSRYLFAMSRDNLVPGFFGTINKKFKTPHIAIIATAFFMILALLLLPLEDLVKAASTVLVLTNILINISLIIVRESRLQNYMPKFRTILYPYLQILSIIILFFILFQMGMKPLFISSMLIVSGIFLYIFYGKIRMSREFALLHIVERITNKEIVSGELEDELKQIIKERDEIVEDRFDKLIEGGTYIDIDKKIDIRDFFDLVSVKLSKKLDLPKEVIFKKFIEREEQSSTVLSNNLAIPHIIIPGEGTFHIILVRCKEGIVFSEEFPNIHAVFILAGTKDERNFHLKILSALAQIVHDTNFEKKWLIARNDQALKDLLLLGKRRRII